MGCGETLGLCVGTGVIKCRSRGCPKPAIVTELLQEREAEHIVLFRRSRWDLLHPLFEREGEALFTCPLASALAEMDGPPVAPGRYRARLDESGDLEFEWLCDE